MKILLITPFENFSGGVESVNKILISIFEEEGHTVDILTSDNYEKTMLNNIMVLLLGLPYITSSRFKNISKQYDIVLANGEFGWGIKHSKCINLFHGTFLGYRDYLNNLWNWKKKLSLTRYAWIQTKAVKNHYVVSVSKFVANILNKQNITVNEIIPNCINTDQFKSDTLGFQKNSYLFVGAYNYYAKGFDVLEKLADLGVKIDCVTNEEPSSKLGWLKNVDNSSMVQIYNQYKILIFPSRFEGMPMVPLEAMSCGLPIVMSNVGLGPELKEHIPEFVIDSYDVKDYQKRIHHIEKNYEKYSKKAREYVEKYHSYENYKKQWLELIEKVKNA